MKIKVVLNCGIENTYEIDALYYKPELGYICFSLRNKDENITIKDTEVKEVFVDEVY